MEDKTGFRKAAIKRRNAVSDRKEQSERITELLLKSPIIREAECVFIYLSFRSEVDTQGLLSELLKKGKKIAAPRVEGSEMFFYEIQKKEDLMEGYMGILEPREGLLPAEPEEKDPILVPGCAFDKKGCRMGYGKGFYDRWIGSQKKDLLCIGLAFREQLYEAIPSEPHDRKLSFVVTPDGWMSA